MMAITDPLVLQSTVDWLKDFLRQRHDLAFTRVVHRPPFWMFYDTDGDFVVKMEEELMDRLHLALNRESFTLGESEPIDQLVPAAEADDRDWDDEDDIEWERA